MAQPGREWSSWGGDPGGSKYSPLTQINKSNVRGLKPLWIFDTTDFSDGKRLTTMSAFEATPLVIDGVMYVTSPFHRLFALDPETGRMLWQFDPKFDTNTRVVLYQSRGVAWWPRGRAIIMADQQARLFSIDSRSGKLNRAFGDNGMINLRQGFTEKFPNANYGLTSPPAVCGDTVITGAWVSDGEPQGPSGDIRGFDARTGREKWRFHTVPRPGEFGNDTWAGDSWRDRGGVNVWSIMSVDDKRGMVFLPLTSPSFDYYGGDRAGANLFADSVVALDCATGARRWHFQTVHHNVWDYDLPSQPMLVTVNHGGRAIDAVAQLTKTGFVFLLHRDSGKPLFEVEERPIPASPVPGEKTWPTQPVPVKPPPFVRQSFKLSELTTVTPESRKECSAMIEGADVEGGLYKPVLEKPTVYFPGTNGGSNWGGGAYDPASGLLYVNSMDVGAFMKLVRRPEGSKLAYRTQGFGRFWDSNRYPCQQPPWGSLTAIDLNRGEIRLRSDLGEYDELTARGIPKTGASNLGGPIVTAGGLVFIGATNDDRLRAFDKDTGEELWTYRLPSSAHSTPITFTAPKSGRQLVVVAAGGGNKYNRGAMAKLIAFALPAGVAAEARVTTAPPRLFARARAGYTGIAEKLPLPAPTQPVPFSHRQHAVTARLACADCHTTASRAERAGLPNAARCVSCHTTIAKDAPGVQALRRIAASNAQINWTRIYKLPEYVFFSHERHAKANVDGAACHGPVAQRDVLAKEVSTGMAACMDCHRQRKASIDCTVCHHLGQ